MRTKSNGELRIQNVGETVTLVGWCSKKRDLGGLVFIDLRDRYGITQLVVKPENEFYSVASNVKNEYVLSVYNDFKKKNDSVVVLTDCALADEDKELFLNLMYEIGFKRAELVPTVLCALIGAGKNISSTKTNLVVCIGGANTDIAVVNMNSIVKGATLGLGGRAVDVAIANTIAYNHGLVVGLNTSETLKKEIGSLKNQP